MFQQYFNQPNWKRDRQMKDTILPQYFLEARKQAKTIALSLFEDLYEFELLDTKKDYSEELNQLQEEGEYITKAKLLGYIDAIDEMIFNLDKKRIFDSPGAMNPSNLSLERRMSSCGSQKRVADEISTSPMSRPVKFKF